MTHGNMIAPGLGAGSATVCEAGTERRGEGEEE